MVKKRYENLIAKYGVTVKEMDRAIEQIKFGNIACDGVVLVALCDLVCNGDIEYGNKEIPV